MDEWSPLKELSHQYRAAAEPLRARLAELRAALKATDDPETVFRLKRRIAELTPILTGMNSLAELTDRYYESGYYCDERYTTNGIRTSDANEENLRETVSDNRKRASSDAEVYTNGMCDKGKITDRRRKGTRCKSEHCIPESERCTEDTPSVCSVLINTPDALNRLLSALDF